MLQITPTLAIDEDAIELEFIRASGPGGQRVNKVATAVQLRFKVDRAGLPEGVRERLVKLAGKRLADDGTLIITARRYRLQERNRQDALDRLADLIRRAVEKPRPRRKTKPSLASKRRRLEAKRRRSQLKRQRRSNWRREE